MSKKYTPQFGSAVDRKSNVCSRWKYSYQLLEMVEEGLLDRDYVILAFCKYLSESGVEDMMRLNEMIDHEQ